MSAVQIILRLHEHRVWSNRKLRNACRDLSDEQFHRRFDIGRGSLWDTLVHIFAAENVWLNTLRGDPTAPLPKAGDFESFAELEEVWDANERRWDNFLGMLTEAWLQRPITRTNQAGITATTPAHDILLHVCDHGAYTAAQAMNMLHHLGVDNLPDRQLITMSREQFN